MEILQTGILNIFANLFVMVSTLFSKKHYLSSTIIFMIVAKEEIAVIILLVATQMIISRLEIKNLHGLYNYNVSFNDDLTFIFGENGCGKTTVLDIVSSIVTGRIYNLFRYKFDEIILSYREKKRSKLGKIRIKSHEDSFELSLNEGDLQETIDDPRKTGEMFSRDEDEYAFDRRFMSRYDFPCFLRKTFNYIYLPLSRNSQDGIDINSLIYRRRRTAVFSDRDFGNKNYLNESLRYVEDIVKTGCMRISSAENKVSEQFKSNLFTSSLKVSSEYNVVKLFMAIKNKETLDSIEQNRLEYIKTLNSIGEWSEDTQKRVDDFFKRYRTAFENAQRDENAGHHSFSLELLMMNKEFNRIKDIAAQAQRIEEEKERIRAPITSFLSTVNDFFNFGEDRKHVLIDNEGQIRIQADAPRRNLSLYNLSSGEKQIVIIFACLIFGLPAGQSGIYIIDEPEASLHLAWQKKFVEAIQNVNGSIQLVFATHSPEIIGRYSNHAVKLQRKISPNAIKKEDICDE